MTESLTSARARLLEIVDDGAVLRLPEPVQLSSGGMSDTFVDVKKALAPGANLRLACEVIAATLAEAGIEFDAIGGMTMGADQFAYGVAMVTDTGWFVVRKEPKGRGTNRLIEGMVPSDGVRAVVVEDTVSTGASLLKAIAAVQAEGADVVAAVTLVDRSDALAPQLAAGGVPYHPIFTYTDLGIAPL